MQLMLSATAALVDFAAIAGVTLASEVAYRLTFSHNDAWPTETRGLQLTALLSLIIVTTNTPAGEYALDRLTGAARACAARSPCGSWPGRSCW